MRRVSSLLFISCVLLALLPTSRGSCKSGEGDPYAPHIVTPDFKRIYQYSPVTPNTDYYDSYYLDVVTYNIQSGLNTACQLNVEAQAAFLRPFHLYSLQEVDINVEPRNYVNQPARFAELTGHSVTYLATIPYWTGLYGGAIASIFNAEETRYQMYNSWTTEMRGVMALRLRPPQLAGKDLWYLSTHFQFDNVTTRIGQANELLDFIKGLEREFPEAYFIIGGDYYAVPGEGSYMVLSSYLTDTWSYFHGGPDGGYTAPSENPVDRFDHIWFKWPPGATVTVVNVVMPAMLNSDHLPIHATFDFHLASPTGPMYVPSTGTGSGTTGQITTGNAPATTGGSSTTGGGAGTVIPPISSTTVPPTVTSNPGGNTDAPSTSGTPGATTVPTTGPTTAPTGSETNPPIGQITASNSGSLNNGTDTLPTSSATTVLSSAVAVIACVMVSMLVL